MNKFLFFIVFGIIHFLIAQDYQPINYPYGGSQDNGRFMQNMNHPPLRFGTASFKQAAFNDTARFCYSIFADSARFKNCRFDLPVYFKNARFNGNTSFDQCRFSDHSDFSNADFDHTTWISNNYFNHICRFDSAEFSRSLVLIKNRFYKSITFLEAKFKDEVYIKGLKSRGDVDFKGSNFTGPAFFEGLDVDKTFSLNRVRFHKKIQIKRSQFSITRFENTIFSQPVLFDNIIFNASAHFTRSVFKDTVAFKSVVASYFLNFRRTRFEQIVDLRGAEFQKINLEQTTIGNEFRIGAGKKQMYDFSRSLFLQRAKIVLFDVAHLKLQPERVKFVTLADHLSYSMKSLIISELKDSCFADDKKSQLELDYIFAKSTMYQGISDDIQINKWYYIWKWPRWISITIYNFAMGMGYRPFRIIFWWLAIMLMFSFWFYKKMPFQICRYLFKSKFKKKEDDSGELPRYNKWDMLVNCIYFSCLIFFSIRLQSDILIDFKGNAKTIIIVEWFVGLLGYVAFITLSKSGSILHTLTSFVLG